VAPPAAGVLKARSRTSLLLDVTPLSLGNRYARAAIFTKRSSETPRSHQASRSSPPRTTTSRRCQIRCAREREIAAYTKKLGMFGAGPAGPRPERHPADSRSPVDIDANGIVNGRQGPGHRQAASSLSGGSALSKDDKNIAG